MKQPEQDLEVELTSDEEQAIRYTCGYVVRSLKKKLSKVPNYIAILDVMHNEEGDEDNSNTF